MSSNLKRKLQTSIRNSLPQCNITESIDPKVSATSNGRTILLSKCAVCSARKSKFIKKQEANRLLSHLRIRRPLSKIPLLGDVLF